MSLLARKLLGGNVSGQSIRFIGSSFDRETIGIDPIVSVPSGTIDGDLIIIIRCNENDAAYTSGATWTYAHYNNSATGTAGNPQIGWRIASSEPASYQFYDKVNGDERVLMLVFRGAQLASVGNIGTASSSPSAPEVKVEFDNSLLLGVYVNGTNGSKTFTPPSGMTTLYAQPDTNNPAINVTKESVDTGLTGVRVATMTTGSKGILINLAPSGSITSNITFVADTKTQNTSNSTSLVINKPTGTIEGDLMIAFMGSDAAITFSGDTSWTEIADKGTAPAMRIAYKVAGASEGASYTFTASSSSSLSGTIATFRNATYDTISSFTTGTTGTNMSGLTVEYNRTTMVGFVLSPSASTGPSINRLTTLMEQDIDAYKPSFRIYYDDTVFYADDTTYVMSTNDTTVSGILVSLKPS